MKPKIENRAMHGNPSGYKVRDATGSQKGSPDERSL